MPTTKPRTMITFNDKELFERVNSYRFEHRFKSQNEALMDLLDKGIESLLDETQAGPTIELNNEEMRVITAYRSADDGAKHYALQMLESNPRQLEKNRA